MSGPRAEPSSWSLGVGWGWMAAPGRPAAPRRRFAGLWVPGRRVGPAPGRALSPAAPGLHVPVVSSSLLFFPQIEADFRLNGECAPRPAPSVPTRRRLPPPRRAGAGQRTDMASQRLSPGSSLTGPIVPIGPPLDPLSRGPSTPRSRPSPEGATETPRRPSLGLGRPFSARILPGKVALSTVGT